MYGDCRKGEVAGRLRPVRWLPHRGGGTIMATQVNGIADKLEQISAQLEKLPPSITQYAVPSSGVYSCRKIAANNLVSMHSYGAAIDLIASSAIIGSGTRRAMARSVGATQSPMRLWRSSNSLDSYGAANGITSIRFILSIDRKSLTWPGRTRPRLSSRRAPDRASARPEFFQFRILLLPQSG